MTTYLVLRCSENEQGHFIKREFETFEGIGLGDTLENVTNLLRLKYIGERVSVVPLYNAVVTINEYYADSLHGKARVYNPPTTEHQWECVAIWNRPASTNSQYVYVTWKHRA